MLLERKLYSTQILDLIKDELLKGTLSPGDKINEAQLSTRLGVSRAPIREALCLLEREGIVVANARGKSIRKLTAKEATDTYLTGAILEAQGVIKTCHLYTDEDFEEIYNTYSGVTEEMVRNNEHLAVDEKFHTLLLKYEENEVLVALSRRLSRRMSKFLLINYWQKLSSAESFYQRHNDLYSILTTRNPKAIEAGVMEHYRALAEQITILMKNES